MAVGDYVFVTVFAVLVLIGAFQDWHYRRLPNALCLATFTVGISSTLAIHGAYAVGLAAIHALLAVLVGMFLFSRGWIGAGDAKFYAGTAAWFPLAGSWLLILCVSLAGLLLLVVWYAFSHAIAAAASGRPNAAEYRKLPYGMAIALGSWVALLMMRAA